MVFNNRKAISVAIAMVMFIGLASAAAVGLYSWHETYSSKFLSKTSQVPGEDLSIGPLSSYTLKLTNHHNLGINYTDISVGGKNCSVNGRIPAMKSIEIDLGDCTWGMNEGTKEVIIYGEKGVYMKKLTLKEPVPKGKVIKGNMYFENVGYADAREKLPKVTKYKGRPLVNKERYYYLSYYNNSLLGSAYIEGLGYLKFNGTASDGYNYSVEVSDTGVLDGFAYSPQIGWVKFNGTASDGHNYSVSLHNTTGELKGYAYSEHIGYIHFNNSAFYGTEYIR